LVLILGQMNRSEGPVRRHLEWLLLFTAGFIVIQDMMFKLEYTNRVLMHSAVLYLAVSIWLPFVLEGIARASGSVGVSDMVAASFMAQLGCAAM